MLLYHPRTAQGRNLDPVNPPINTQDGALRLSDVSIEKITQGPSPWKIRKGLGTPPPKHTNPSTTMPNKSPVKLAHTNQRQGSNNLANGDATKASSSTHRRRQEPPNIAREVKADSQAGTPPRPPSGVVLRPNPNTTPPTRKYGRCRIALCELFAGLRTSHLAAEEVPGLDFIVVTPGEKCPFANAVAAKNTLHETLSLDVINCTRRGQLASQRKRWKQDVLQLH